MQGLFSDAATEARRDRRVAAATPLFVVSISFIIQNGAVQLPAGGFAPGHNQPPPSVRPYQCLPHSMPGASSPLVPDSQSRLSLPLPPAHSLLPRQLALALAHSF